MQLLGFKVFHTICMYQFGWLSERGVNFLNLLQKEGLPRKGGGGGSIRKGGFPTLEETDFIRKSQGMLIKLVIKAYELKRNLKLLM